MKKLFLIAIIAFTTFGQLKFTEFKLGRLNPKDTKSGFYGTVSAGSMFDANLGYALEVGYFGKRYVSERAVGTDSTYSSQIVTKQIELTTSTTLIPVMFKFNYVKELGTTFLFKSDIGIGYNFFWDSYDNKIDKKSDTRFFSGFNWQFGADVGMQISSKGSVFAGLFYNSGTVTNSDEIKGLPVYDEIDLSGLGFRFTIRIDGLGIL
jgi:hypothetical protein